MYVSNPQLLCIAMSLPTFNGGKLLDGVVSKGSGFRVPCSRKKAIKVSYQNSYVNAGNKYHIFMRKLREIGYPRLFVHV